jgi:signal transduction histidine kinase
MTILSSLRSRIFLASALLTVLAIGAAVYLVNVRVSDEAERTLQRELVSTAALVDQLRTTRTETFAQMARFIADAPKVKAAVDTNDPPTVQDIANGYQDQLKSNLLLVTNKNGEVLAMVGATSRSALVAASQPAVRDALTGHESFSLLPQPDGVLQFMTVPIAIGLTQPEILGTLSVGFLLDNAVAAQLKDVTGSDIAFGMNGEVLAATLPREDYAALADQFHATSASRISLGGQDYVALPRPLAAAGSPADGGAVALILRSRTEQFRFLQAIRIGLGVTAALAVVVATLFSFVVARTITRPLAAITDAMREVAATGDLTRKIVIRHDSRWDDEDARLLATTFNTLTDSVSRFQRELSQKERLTSLGRLSTVIAHEVRNPLMIIKTALHQLRQPAVSATELREAVADIDGEVARLNRIVNEVLDFGRPIRFEPAPTDLNALCRDSAAASEKGTPGASIGLELDPALPTVTTDAERLRIALVNMLVNARHAATGDGGGVTIKTAVRDGRATITIGDRGAGIAPGDLPHIFDPYFTTKRGGTGLGLPIAKNIVEGLGGAVTVSSAVGRGTQITIELPVVPPPQ